MEIAEQYIKYVLQYALETCPEEFLFLENFEKTVRIAFFIYSWIYLFIDLEVLICLTS
jgi:hypothetical protein